MNKKLEDLLIYLILVIVGAIYFTLGIHLNSIWHLSYYEASLNNIRGVYLSILVYDGYGSGLEYFTNVIAYYVFLALFILVSYTYSTEQKLYSTLTIVPSVFVSAILANIAWLHSPRLESYTWGQSGVVYAFLGAIFTYSLINLYNLRGKFEKTRRSNLEDNDSKESKQNISMAVLNAFALFIPIIFFLLTPNVVGGMVVNKTVHAYSFLICALLSYLCVRLINTMKKGYTEN